MDTYLLLDDFGRIGQAFGVSATGMSRSLSVILCPRLLPAPALEHADPAAICGIEDGPNQRGLTGASTARPNWVRIETGKNLVFEFVVHTFVSFKMDKGSHRAARNCRFAWNYPEKAPAGKAEAGAGSMKISNIPPSI
jgi:hypothetical protein